MKVSDHVIRCNALAKAGYTIPTPKGETIQRHVELVQHQETFRAGSDNYVYAMLIIEHYTRMVNTPKQP